MTTKRILFVSTATSYRNHAFIAAADTLQMPWLLVCDHQPAHIDPEAVLVFRRNDLADLRTRIVALHAEYPFAAVLALDDSGAHLAVDIADSIGLPHNTLAATTAARNKYAMRQALRDADIPLPWFACFRRATPLAEILAQIPFPCVIKPLELNGSRGVMRADSDTEFVQVHARLMCMLDTLYPGGIDHEFLVESFIPGFEVALEAILDAGEVIPLALFDKPDPLDGPFFEETIYVTPSRLSADIQAEIMRVTSCAAQAIGLQMGPLHAELRVNEAGVYLVEVAGRSIGGLCSQTLQFGSAESLEMLILRQAVGVLATRPQRESTAGGVMMIPIPCAGILQRIDGIADAQAVPLIDEISITAPLHRPIQTLPEGESYLGFIFARGHTPGEVEQALRDAHALLRIHITPAIQLSP